MCTNIAKQITVEGTGKGATGWFAVKQANVSYDHPFEAPMDHALNIDFVNEAQGPGARAGRGVGRSVRAEPGGNDPLRAGRGGPRRIRGVGGSNHQVLCLHFRDLIGPSGLRYVLDRRRIGIEHRASAAS